MTEAYPFQALFPEALKRLLRAYAVLDAILSPEWEYRYFSYDPHWGNGQHMASIRNGGGDDVFIWFGPAGVYIKGFAHELYDWDSKDEVDALYASVPAAFHEAVNEPAFTPLHLTYCFWREAGEASWDSIVSDYDKKAGATHLLDIVNQDPRSFQSYAASYHEIDLALGDIESVFNEMPLRAAKVKAINPNADNNAVLEEVGKMGYPVRRQEKPIKKKNWFDKLRGR